MALWNSGIADAAAVGRTTEANDENAAVAPATSASVTATSPLPREALESASVDKSSAALQGGGELRDGGRRPRHTLGGTAAAVVGGLALSAGGRKPWRPVGGIVRALDRAPDHSEERRLAGGGDMAAAAGAATSSSRRRTSQSPPQAGAGRSRSRRPALSAVQVKATSPPTATSGYLQVRQSGMTSDHLRVNLPRPLPIPPLFPLAKGCGDTRTRLPSCWKPQIPRRSCSECSSSSSGRGYTRRRAHGLSASHCSCRTNRGHASRSRDVGGCGGCGLHWA